MSSANAKVLKVAIVGAGPGGLAAAILLSKLPFVELSVFEQARELREVGAGISINQNTWRLLQVLGAADALEEFGKRGDGSVIDVEQRNGLTGELLGRKYQSIDPNSPARSRIERYKLQQALLSRVSPSLIQLRKRLRTVDDSGDETFLEFEDGSRAGPFHLVVGADGLRSAVRQHAFPDHKIAYTGKVAYRVLIPQEKVAHIPNIPPGSCFWHTPSTHVYTNPLDNGLFEIATRATESEEHGNKVSWGQVVPKSQVVKHYQEYCNTIRAVIDAPDEWLEFAMFGGPKLETVISGGRIVLIGDASHPLSGAFGSGAAFAFEDAFTLSSALEYTWNRRLSVAKALEIFDSIRGPHYEKLFAVLDTMAANAKAAAISAKDDPNHRVEQTVSKNWKANETAWIYEHNIVQVWGDWVTLNDLKDLNLNAGNPEVVTEGSQAFASPAVPIAA